MIGDEIIGFNAFISHDLVLNGEMVNCYQSCFTATSNQHRGKKIFQNLILTAHEILRARGAGFIFGFPNDSSYPLFTKKLGYKEIASVKWNMLNILGYRSQWFEKNSESLSTLNRNAILQNDRQLIELKRVVYGRELLSVNFQGSIAWGLRRSTIRRGIHIPYLDLGGVELAEPSHLRPLLDCLRNEAGFVTYVQAVSTNGSSFNRLLRKVQRSETNCMIVYDLNIITSKEVCFNFFKGVWDVY
jgi:hypothetical protein